MGNMEILTLFVLTAMIIPVSVAGVNLTAGDFDDNLNYDHFQDYLDGEYKKDGRNILPRVDLSNRITIRITDENGRGLPDHGITILGNGTGETVIDTHSGFDGTFRFFPGFDDEEMDNPAYDILVPNGADIVKRTIEIGQMSSDRTIDIVLERAKFITPKKVDICFVIDTTGSMGDELEYIKGEFNSIVSMINSTYQVDTMRFALVVYRDTGDTYITQEYDFTTSVDQMRGWLSNQAASGGGDYPEAMDIALQKANKLDWSKGNAARIMFLVADAPPHDSYLADMVTWIKESRDSGIHIYPLASSGVGDVAEFVMRIAAVTTHGRYLFLTDDSGVGNSHAEPHIPGYVVTTLKDLMVRIVDSEISGKRVEATPDQVIRTVGNVVNGVVVTDEELQQIQNVTQGEEGPGTDDTVSEREESDEDGSPEPCDEPIIIEDEGSTTTVTPPSVTDSGPDDPSGDSSDDPSTIYAWDPISDDDDDDSVCSPCDSVDDGIGGLWPEYGEEGEDDNSLILGILLIPLAIVIGSILLTGYVIKKLKKGKKE